MKRRFSIVLDESLYRDLKVFAAIRDETMSAVIERAVRAEIGPATAQPQQAIRTLRGRQGATPAA